VRYREAIKKYDFYPAYDYDEDLEVGIEWNLLAHLGWQTETIETEYELGI